MSDTDILDDQEEDLMPEDTAESTYELASKNERKYGYNERLAQGVTR